MRIASSSSSVADLFTKGSHHRNLTVIYLVQNVYNHGKSYRTISLNSHYSVVFRNGLDVSQFRTMAYQICLNDGKLLVDFFTDAISKFYGYLVLDDHPSTPEDQTVVTNILPGDQLTYYINCRVKVRWHYNFVMGNSQSKLKHKSNELNVVKRTIKFLSIAPDLEVVRAVIKKEPNTVIGAISNGALNCRQSVGHITLHLIPLFNRHNKHFDYLVDRKKSIPFKRNLILQ